MKQLVIISGKGGTGKTSITASFAVLAKKHIMADCDVDAADLHLILEPEIKQSGSFIGGKEAKIRSTVCTNCGKCYELCKFEAIVPPGKEEKYSVDPLSCEGCGVCVWFCPVDAIDFNEKINGEWFISDTRYGPMVHAKLGIAEENSGKLVSLVREKARDLADSSSADLIIVDGPPGTGCPVIASITGSDLVIAVTEPTSSGVHDLTRVVDLANYFKIPITVIINKHDINPNISRKIEGFSESQNIPVIGRIPYDESITKAQIQGKSIVEIDSSKATKEIKKIWKNIEKLLSQ
jgi:MinD superfamily P-loop ATPase